jgi:uncharacterized protein (DUF1330 family)
VLVKDYSAAIARAIEQLGDRYLVHLARSAERGGVFRYDLASIVIADSPSSTP